MCLAIYLALIALFIYYSHSVIEQYSLAVSSAQGDPMVVAVGWEMVGPLWPLLVAAMLLASAVSVFVTRRCSRCATGG